MEPIAAEEGRKPFLLVGSALTSIFVVGVVALVISLAVSIRPTVDQRPSPGPERDCAQHRGARARRRCRKHSSPSRRLHLRRPSNRRCPSPCRRRPRLSRRRARYSSSRPPPRRRQRPPRHRLRHRLHPRRRRPHRFPWHQRRCPISRRRCTTRRCTTRTCRRRFTTRGPGRGHLRMHRRGSSSRRSLKNRRSHRGTAAVAGIRRRLGSSGGYRVVTYPASGSGGYPGSGGSGGSSGGNGGGSGGCFLIFCGGGPAVTSGAR